VPSNKFIKGLKEVGGCGLLIYLILAIVLGGAIYQAAVYGFGDPKIKRIGDFANECFNREESKSGKSMIDMSESERAQINDACAAEYEDYLARERQK
jgi:hypothetical protein